MLGSEWSFAVRTFASQLNNHACAHGRVHGEKLKFCNVHYLFPFDLWALAFIRNFVCSFASELDGKYKQNAAGRCTVFIVHNLMGVRATL